MFKQYRKDSIYDGADDEPAGDAVSLALEPTPIYKLWLTPPVETEAARLKGTWEYFAMVPPWSFPGGLPMFVFGSAQGSVVIRAPLTGTSEQQARAWAEADSNIVTIILIERGSRLIRQMRTIGLPGTLRRAVAAHWLNAARSPIDGPECQRLIASIDDHAALNAADVWEYEKKRNGFRQIRWASIAAREKRQ